MEVLARRSIPQPIHGLDGKSVAQGPVKRLNRRTLMTAAIAAAAALGLGILHEALLSRRLAAAIAAAQNDRKEMARLLADNQRLRSLLPTQIELARLRRARVMLAHLRGNPMPDPGDAQASNPAEAVFKARVFSADKLSHPGEWENAGTATPRAAFETWLYAKDHADVDAQLSLTHLNEAAEAEAQALFARLTDAQRAEYQTPDRLIAMLMVVPGPGPAFAGAQVLEEIPPVGNRATLRTQWQYTDGRIRDNDFQLENFSGAWGQSVSANLVKELIDFRLNAATPPSH